MSATGVQLKLYGKRLSAKKYHDALRLARSIARGLGLSRGSITIEDVRGALQQMGACYQGNWLGSVFDGEEWECCGFVAARRPEARGRILRQWRLRA
jgi:hypothetical protein